jgi:hypothetical protein
MPALPAGLAAEDGIPLDKLLLLLLLLHFVVKR